MRQAHRRIGFVDVLAAGTRGAESIHAHVGRINQYVADIIGFRHDRHRRGRSVNAPLRFGGGHALHAMAAGFKFQARVSALADDACDHLLVAADFALRLRNDFNLPAISFGVARVHAKQISGEERGFIATCAAANLDENILVVVRILRQQLLLQVRLERFQFGFARLYLGIGKFAGVGIGGHFHRRRNVGLRHLILLEQRDDGCQLSVLTRYFAIAVHVVDDVRIGKKAVKFNQAFGE